MKNGKKQGAKMEYPQPNVEQIKITALDIKENQSNSSLCEQVKSEVV